MKNKRVLLNEQMSVDEWIDHLDMNVDMYSYYDEFVLRIMNGIQINMPIHKTNSLTKSSAVDRVLEKYKKKARITSKAYVQFLNAIAIECQNEINKLP